MDATARPLPAAATTVDATMRAVTQDVYGTSETWRLANTDLPKIGAKEVLVRVQAAGIDRGTEHLMTGHPYIFRAMGAGLRRPRNRIPGLALAGTVVAVGSKVTRFSVGDEVFGAGRGSLAEYAAAREAKLFRKPSNLTFEQAAAVPVSATAANRAVQAGRIEAGQKVLVVGASGGVGTYALQIAKALGAEVTAVCSTAKIDLVRALGADHVVDYTKEDATDGSQRYDVILDVGGNTPLRKLRRGLTPTGSLVLVGGEDGGHWTGGLGRSLLAPLWSIVLRQRFAMFVSVDRSSDLETLTGLIESGQVMPQIDRTYPLDESGAAMHGLETGQVRGKVVIAV